MCGHTKGPNQLDTTPQTRYKRGHVPADHPAAEQGRFGGALLRARRERPPPREGLRRGQGGDPRASRGRAGSLHTDHPKAACRLLASKRFGAYLSRDDNGRPYLDQDKVRRAGQLDGKFVLTTNDDTLSVADIALGYKGMWVIEIVFTQMTT